MPRPPNSAVLCAPPTTPASDAATPRLSAPASQHTSDPLPRPTEPLASEPTALELLAPAAGSPSESSPPHVVTATGSEPTNATSATTNFVTNESDSEPAARPSRRHGRVGYGAPPGAWHAGHPSRLAHCLAPRRGERARHVQPSGTPSAASRLSTRARAAARAA